MKKYILASIAIVAITIALFLWVTRAGDKNRNPDIKTDGVSQQQKTVTPIPSAAKSPEQQSSPVSTGDSEPLISCQIHANCGGGTIRLTMRECQQTICCYKDNQWMFLREKNLCG